MAQAQSATGITAIVGIATVSVALALVFRQVMSAARIAWMPLKLGASRCGIFPGQFAGGFTHDSGCHWRRASARRRRYTVYATWQCQIQPRAWALCVRDRAWQAVRFWRAQGTPAYQMEILETSAKDGEDRPRSADQRDQLYDEALQIVLESGQASVSMIQRRLRIGYNRSARIVEQMEREGLVTAADGARPRELRARSDLS